MSGSAKICFTDSGEPDEVWCDRSLCPAVFVTSHNPKEGQTVTGRTMDWFVSDMDTNLWLYPRGLERTGNTRTPFHWKSK